MSVVSVRVTRHPRVAVRPRSAGLSLCSGEPGAQISVVAGVPGPQGPPGVALAYRYDQTAPSASWVISHGLGRVPLVDVFLTSGEQVDADVFATSSTISVVFAAATTGFVTYI